MKRFVILIILMTGCSLWAQMPVYLDETMPLDERADDALSRMTDAEKQELARTCTDLCSSGVPRLGIPPFVVDTTRNLMFPSFESLAATWNPGLSDALGVGMAEQAIYRRIDAVYDKGLWAMSDDPYLVSMMAQPYIDGIQQCGEAVLEEWLALGKMETASQDELLREVLMLYFQTSMSHQRPMGFLGTEAQQATAKAIAEESIVLLKNDRDILPLHGSSVRKLLMVGNRPVEGLQERIAQQGPTVQCETCSFEEAFHQAETADIIIFTEDFSDQNALPLLKKVPAVIQTWDLGMEGAEALASILTGKVNPSGKLPYEWKGEEGKEPLFALGHGLSYTTFEFTDFKLSGREIPIGGDLIGTVTVTNTGHREGDVTVQLYIHDIKSSVPKPDKELKGFQKVRLQPGESQEISFAINEAMLMFFDEAQQQWWAEPGFYVAFVGEALDKLPLKARFHLK